MSELGLLENLTKHPTARRTSSSISAERRKRPGKQVHCAGDDMNRAFISAVSPQQHIKSTVCPFYQRVLEITAIVVHHALK
jgi:hypothetical protein